MWVRSQDKKTLCFVKQIFVNDKQRAEYFLTGYNDNYNWTTDLGTYESESRALEVLEEIQKFINHDIRSVFEMPEK